MGSRCAGRATGAVAACLLVLAGGSSAQEFESVRIGTLGLAPGVFMLTGQGGNLGVSVGDDGALLVDDQFAPLTDRIRRAVAELTSQPIRFVLNTHWHSDHTGGNENLGRAGALIVAHANVRRRMSTEQFMEAFGRRVPPASPDALPVVTFSEAVTFHWNGDEIHVEHVPSAHTDGDAIVHFRRANVIHMGDTFFHGMYPFIDSSSGGSLEGVLAAVDRGLALADEQTRIIPGHGPAAVRSDLAAYRAMLATLGERVRAARAAGGGLEQLLASRPTADFDARWGGGFLDGERFVRILWAGLEDAP